MRPSHLILACLASIIWGLAFVFTKLGLDSFSAPQLTALRFLIACPLVFFLPRPAVSWSMLVAIGLLAPCVGMLSSAIVFGEVFGAARYGGMALNLLGLAVIVLPIGWLRACRAGG